MRGGSLYRYVRPDLLHQRSPLVHFNQTGAGDVAGYIAQANPVELVRPSRKRKTPSSFASVASSIARKSKRRRKPDIFG